MPKIQGADSPRELRAALMRATDNFQPINPRFVAADIAEWEAVATTPQDHRTLQSLRKLEQRNQEALDRMRGQASGIGSSDDDGDDGDVDVDTLPGYENIVSESMERVDPDDFLYHGTRGTQFERFQPGVYGVSMATDYGAAHGYAQGSEIARSERMGDGDEDESEPRVIASRLNLEGTPHGWELPKFTYTETPDIDPELIGQADWSGIHNESAERAEELGYPGYILGDSGEVVLFDGDHIEIVSHDYQGGGLPVRENVNQSRDLSAVSNALQEYRQSVSPSAEATDGAAGMADRSMEYRGMPKEASPAPKRGRGRIRY